MDRPVGFFTRSFWRGTTTLQPTLEAGTALGILLALVLLTVIGWLYLDQAAEITKTRAEIATLQGQRDRALLEICYLQSELARLTSTQNVLEHGRAEGFHAPGQIVTLDVRPLPVPADALVAEALPPAESRGAPAAQDSPWWYSALSWLEDAIPPSAARW